MDSRDYGQKLLESASIDLREVLDPISEVQALWLGSSRQRLCVVHAPPLEIQPGHRRFLKRLRSFSATNCDVLICFTSMKVIL